MIFFLRIACFRSVKNVDKKIGECVVSLDYCSRGRAEGPKAPNPGRIGCDLWRTLNLLNKL